MFGRLKKMLAGKSAEEGEESSSVAVIPPAEPEASASGKGAKALVTSNPSSPSTPPLPPPPPAPSPPPPRPCIVLPFDAVIDQCPRELVAAWSDQFDVERRLRIPLETLEPGLRQGRLVFAWMDLLSFLDPPILTRPEALFVQATVELPLREVVPSFLQVSGLAGVDASGLLPADVPDLFFSLTEQEAEEAARRASAPAAAPSAPAVASKSAPANPPSAPAGGKTADVRADAPVAAAAVSKPVGRETDARPPAKPASVASNGGTPTSTRPGATSLPEDAPFLCVPLPSLLPHWPESIRQLLNNMEPSRWQVRFPVERVEPQLKAGRIAFKWREIVSWTVPPSPLLSDLAEADTAWEIPAVALARPYMVWKNRARKISGTSVAPRPAPAPARAPEATPKAAPQAAPPTPARPAQATNSASSTATAAARSAHNVPAEASQLLEAWQRIPGVDGVVVMDGEGRFLAGVLPPGVDRGAAVAMLPKLHQQMSVALASIVGSTERRFLVATGPHALLVARVAGVFVIAAAAPSATAVAQLAEGLAVTPATSN